MTPKPTARAHRPLELGFDVTPCGCPECVPPVQLAFELAAR